MVLNFSEEEAEIGKDLVTEIETPTNPKMGSDT